MAEMAASVSPSTSPSPDPLEVRAAARPERLTEDRLDLLMMEMGSLKKSVARMSACLDRLTDSHAHLADRLDGGARTSGAGEAPALGRDESGSEASSPGPIGRNGASRLSCELFVEESSMSDSRGTPVSAALANAESGSVADGDFNEDDTLLMQRDGEPSKQKKEEEIRPDDHTQCQAANRAFHSSVSPHFLGTVLRALE